MAKPLVVSLNGLELPLQLARVERADLYGRIDVEALDSQGRPCTLATLADDGKTIIGTSGTALAMLSPDGSWVEKKSLIPTDNQGHPVPPVPSTYASAVALAARATIDEYLSHTIRSVYEVTSDVDLAPLMAELEQGTIFQFPYSYRGGIEADVAFLLLSADAALFLVIGSPAKLEFVGLDQPSALSEDEDETEDDEIDFGMI